MSEQREHTQGRWTEAQLRAITATGCSLLVSAAAGSGKTAVLAERCAHLVCDADRSARCDIDELLVVTFTNAAAAEMRSRIEQTLRRKLSENSDHARLARQLALIERAQISTLHGFCSGVLRQYFHLIGLDPNFSLLDEPEAVLLRAEVARALFDARYEGDGAGEFQQLIDRYGDGDDQRLIDRVIHTHALLCSVVDPAAWMETARRRIDDGAKDLGHSDVGRELLVLLRSQIDGFRKRCIRACDQLAAMGSFDGYIDAVGEYIAAAEGWATLKGPTLLSQAILSFTPPELPRLSSDIPGKDLAKALVDSIRKELGPKGALYELCRFTGAEWQQSLTAIQSPTKTFLELVSDFREWYRDAKNEQRSLDFSDLERLTLQILRDDSVADILAPSPTARDYHQRFRYVLVDEYQDINPIQDAILTLVSHECLLPTSHPPLATNLFCVGDVKQSIYRFRLAEPQRFTARLKKFREDGKRFGEAIDLQANFRSRGPLLDSINAVFSRLMTADAAELTYDESHKLREGLKYPKPAGASINDCFSGAPVELHLLPKPPRGASASDDVDEIDLDRSEREAAFVAHRIRQLMGQVDGCRRMQVFRKADSGGLEPRPIEYRDIVVLLRAMKVKSDQFAEQLRAAGIPVHSESATGFFESMEIRDMLALLRLLDNQRQDVPMAAVLRSPLVALPNPDDCLARIRLAYREKNWLPFHAAVVRYIDDHDDELAAALDGFREQLAKWREIAHRRPLAELLWTIYDQTGYLAFCQGLVGGEQRVANLIALHERARQFGTFQRQDLGRFMQFLSSLQEESDLGQSSIASEAENVVRVMSVHRSKGLEFPVVFLPDLGKKHNLADASGALLVDREAYLGMQAVDETKRIRYPSLAWTLAKDRITRQLLAEEMRVLYVAMTRAREHLILVGTCETTKPEQWREKWSARDGPLPCEEVLRGCCMLDWLGPISASLATRSPKAFEVTLHNDQELIDWARVSIRQPQLSPGQSQLASLAPLKSPPPMTDRAQRVLDRVCQAYSHEPFPDTAAVRSVTSLTKTGRAAPGGESPSRRDLVRFDEELALPRCMTIGQTPAVAPTDVGAATHLVLQHLDFAADASAASIQQQLRRLESRRLITPAQAAMVDINGIAWLMTSELGDLLRRHAKTVCRELPVYFPAPADVGESSDPLDRIMVRGKIDVLIRTDKGLIVGDYKTDRVTTETLAARAEFYRPQLLAYADNVSRIANQPLLAAYLVFLTARAIVPAL